MTSSASTTQQPAAQPGPQWVTPALLVSLILFMAVVSFGLLTDLRGFRAEIKADLRSFQQEMRQEFRREIKTEIGGVNDSMDALRIEIKADNQQLASRMDSLDDHMDKLDGRMDKLGADLNGRMDRLAAELNGRIDQVYQLLLPAEPKP